MPQPIGYQKCADVLKDNGYIALFWNMYVIHDNDLDKELLEISKRYGGIADFVSESECESRIDSIVSQIVDSNLFEKPTVSRKLWKQDYTANDFYGFALTGNRFIQNSDEDKKKSILRYCFFSGKERRYHRTPILMCALHSKEKIVCPYKSRKEIDLLISYFKGAI